jgi:aryl-alcohol dehydrogenase-like predicted oxidoreductase
MKQRTVGPFQVSAIGLGCMSLSHAYGDPPDPAEAARVLLAALDLGYTFLDTAALYGFGKNERLVGETLKGRRADYTLASKCGLIRNDEGKREVNGRPEVIKRTCEESLRNLQTDVIDLYYLHRLDRGVPIEDSVGAMAELVSEGKVRTLGLSEMSAETLRRAHAVHPISAMQTEYSLWTRNPEVAVVDACRDIGAAFVAFSPVGRGFLAGGVRSLDELPAGDIRRNMPRFQGDNFTHNLRVLGALETAAAEAGCTPAQACLAWLLQRDPIIVPIPGTTRLDHLAENAAADTIVLSADALTRLEAAVNPANVAGHRYPPGTLAEIDTEEMVA